jgi:hypothetical protein
MEVLRFHDEYVKLCKEYKREFAPDFLECFKQAIENGLVFLISLDVAE